MDTIQKSVYSLAKERIISRGFSNRICCILTFFVVGVFLHTFNVCAATTQSQAPSVSIIANQPVQGTSLYATVNTTEKYILKWYVDNTQVAIGPSYIPTTSDYEKWIKVVLVSASSGKTLSNDSIYFSNLPVIYINTDDGQSITSHR